jgi:type VI secretion system protein ImpE
MTATPSALLENGALEEAIEALNLEVRKNPNDLNRRGALAELLCFAGNFDRADRLLDAMLQLDPRSALGIALFRQLIRAEEARQQFYTEGRLPEFLEAPTEHDQLYFRALVELKDGNAQAAARLLADAEAQRPAIRGTLDGVAFDDMRDLDDLAASHFDILTSNGKFYRVPLRRFESAVFHAPERQRDLLWRRATVAVIGGPDGDVFFPTIYPFYAKPPSAALRLGRETAFTEEAPIRGSGLRTFLVGEEARTIMELGKLEFASQS